MRAKKINEISQFKRGANPKESLGVGMYGENPMPSINLLSKKYMQKPTSLSFKNWINEMNIAKKEFLSMILSAAFLEEFGAKVVKDENPWNDTHKVNLGRYEIRLIPSDTWITWKVRIVDRKKGNDIFLTASTQFDVLAKKVKIALEKLEKQNIKI